MRTNVTTAATLTWDAPDRVLAYRLLSDLFARELRAARITELAQAAENDVSRIVADPALRPLFECFKDLGEDPAEAERDLAGVFAFLFLGAGGGQSAPPYESVFANELGRTNQTPTALMAEEIAKLGLHVEETFPEPADHIAVELATAAALIESDSPVERQRAFLEERLASWLPRFAAACSRGDRNGFYATAARATAAFIQDDLNRLAAGSDLGGKE